jgi:hypothetical protein
MYARSIAMGVGFAVVGGGVGWAYFSILRTSVEARAGRSSGGRFALLALARVAIFAGCLAPAFWLGTGPVIGYMAGFVVARTVLVSRARREIAEMGGADGDSPAES